LLKLPNLTCIHSVDSLKLAKKISERARVLDRTLDIMLQLKPKFYLTKQEATQILKLGTCNAQEPINYSLTKSGMELNEINTVINFLNQEQNSLRFSGIMIIGEPGDLRIFETMSNIKNAIEEHYELNDLGKQ
jgi:uncharacterized pyridoxal phosphate-containing UPF0001 family protein